MTWPLDQSPIPEPEEDNTSIPEPDSDGHVAAAPVGTATPRRTNADEVLDAVEGRQAYVHRDVKKCPVCGAESRVLPSAIGTTMIMRRCTVNSCRHEYAVSSTRVQIDVPPPPPNPMILGGPYKGGPDRGGGRPHIDPYEPIQRRVAEVMRRIVDED